jgi:hypothetical protein
MIYCSLHFAERGRVKASVRMQIHWVGNVSVHGIDNLGSDRKTLSIRC